MISIKKNFKLKKKIAPEKFKNFTYLFSWKSLNSKTVGMMDLKIYKNILPLCDLIKKKLPNLIKSFHFSVIRNYSIGFV